MTETTPATDSQPEVQETAQGGESQAWDENFKVDVTPHPEEEVVEVTGDDETEEPSAEPELPEYKTEGLGELDTPLVVKVKGKVYDLKDLNKIRDLVERGFVATQKMQEIAEMKRELLKAKEGYTDEEAEQVVSSEEVEAVAKSILESESADTFRSIVSTLPEDAKQLLATDASAMRGLHQDIEAGIAQKIMPKAERYMLIDGLPFKEAYVKAGMEVLGNDSKIEEAKTRLTSTPRTEPVSAPKEKDIWDMSPEEYASLMASERR